MSLVEITAAVLSNSNTDIFNKSGSIIVTRDCFRFSNVKESKSGSKSLSARPFPYFSDFQVLNCWFLLSFRKKSLNIYIFWIIWIKKNQSYNLQTFESMIETQSSSSWTIFFSTSLAPYSGS
jgi:hypothetical protein